MDRDAKLTIVARAVHETIRAFQGAVGEKEVPPWHHSGWMQSSTREAVELALTNPTPGALHEAWRQSRLRDGWRHGPIKDETQKTHPSIVPFEALPESEQTKDALVIAVARALGAVLQL